MLFVVSTRIAGATGPNQQQTPQSSYLRILCIPNIMFQMMVYLNQSNI